MSALDYSAMTRDAALRFLQTAVVVDDAATVETEAERTGTARDPKLSDRIGTIEDGDTGGDSESDSPPPVKVDVKGLADVLADMGITCGVLRPRAKEGVSIVNKRIASVSARVDLVILDWMLDEDTQLTSLKAIQETVKADRRGCRVIAVYTSQSNLRPISEELKDAVPDIKPVNQSESMFSIGGTRIALIRKAEKNSTGEDENRANSGADDPYESLTVDELGPRLIDIFTDVAEGWVRSIALHSMAAIRENFHMVLSGLDASLDLGYAGNLLRLEHIEEGPRHLLDSIGGEFRGVIEDDRLSIRIAGRPALEAWLSERAVQDGHAISPDLLARFLDASGEERDNAKGMIKTEIDDSGRLPEKLSKGKFKEVGVTMALAPDFDPEAAKKADSEFAKLLALRRFHGEAARTLHLGTIVRKRGGGYWLCVQPVCDSVRLDNASSRFPMIPLESVNKKPFHFVVRTPDDDKIVQLRNLGKPHLITMFDFEPDIKSGTVVFKHDRRVSKKAPYVRARDKTVLEWIGELKPTHSNRVAHGLGRQLTRIGLDESEWLNENSD